ncbi:MAG: hypothetical protein IAE82_04990 [Opitutaceae bacterium]|nr:hypothetical protein [Opitutaceae bacterium]
MHPDTDPLTELWGSPENQPTTAAADRLASVFVTRMRARRRFQTVWLAWTVVAMLAISGLAGVQLAHGRVHGDGILNLTVLIAAPWLATAWLYRTWRRGATTPAPQAPLRETILIARQANRAARLRLRVVAGLIVTMLPLLALAITHLHEVGKLATREAWSMGLVFGAALATSLVVMAWRDRSRLAPESRQLDALARDIDRP